MDTLDGEGGVRDYNLERLIMLSDGVFAIAMTLLAFEVKPPEHWDGTAAGLLHGSGQLLIAYMISFLSIAGYWIMHRRNFSRFRRADTGLTLTNFLILGLVTLVPIGTRLITDHPPFGEATMIYVGLVASIGAANALQWGYAAFIGRGIIDPSIPVPARIVALLMLLFVPGTMTALGFMSGQDGHKWMIVPLFAFWAAIFIARRYLRRQGLH